MEEWRDLKVGYQVSDQGRVRNAVTKRLLKPQNLNGVYHKVTIHGKMMSLHSAVALAFLGPAPPDSTVDHINRDPTDNRLQNLRWATRRQQNLNRKLSSVKGYRKVTCRRQDGSVVVYDSMSEAAKRHPCNHKYNVSRAAIERSVRTGKPWKGEQWEHSRENKSGFEIKPVPNSFLRSQHVFLACSDGTVQLKKKHWSLGSVLPAGYRRVTLNNKGYLVHRLIALAFLGDPPFAEAVVNHKNGLKGDNRADNLEWLSCSANSLHGWQFKKNVGL